MEAKAGWRLTCVQQRRETQRGLNGSSNRFELHFLSCEGEYLKEKASRGEKGAKVNMKWESRFSGDRRTGWENEVGQRTEPLDGYLTEEKPKE